jgi:hypothetical protein
MTRASDLLPGMRPLSTPVAAATIALRLQANRDADGDKPTAAGSRLRCSDAFKCSRSVAFGSTKVPRDVPLDAKSLAIFAMGDYIHQGLQEALIVHFEARCEVLADWNEAGLSLSGRADALYTWKSKFKPAGSWNVTRVPTNGDKVLVEAKSMSGYGFKYPVEGFVYKDADKAPSLPGPKAEHLVQAGLYALAPTIGAEFVHIVYVNKDTQDVAEWIIHVDEELTHLDGRTVRGMVEWETKRLAGILGRIDAGTIPARYVPDHGVVVAPAEGKSTKSHRLCGYCAWLPTCQDLPQEAVPFSELPREKQPLIGEDQ